MSETETETTKTDKPIRRRRARRTVTAAPAAPKPASKMTGVTAETCPAACTPTNCIFVEKPYCAHPFKGGPQGADMNNPEVLARINEAKRIIGKRKVDARFG